MHVSDRVRSGDRPTCHHSSLGIRDDESDDGLLVLSYQNVALRVKRDLHIGVAEKLRHDGSMGRLEDVCAGGSRLFPPHSPRTRRLPSHVSRRPATASVGTELSAGLAGVLIATRGPGSPRKYQPVAIGLFRDGLERQVAGDLRSHAGLAAWRSPLGSQLFRLPVVGSKSK